MKKVKRLYGFGGDDDKTPQPRKVDTVPSGYVIDTDYIDKQNPNRKYYKKVTTTSGTTPALKPVVKRPITSSKDISMPVKRVYKPPVNTQNNSIDRIYIEPLPVKDTSTVAPTNAFRGNNIFMNTGVSNKAIGQAQYPTRKSVNASDAGMLNTGDEDVLFQYYMPNSSQLSGDTIKIPSTDWNSRGNVSNFADSSFINKYRKPKMAAGGTTGGGMGSIYSQIPGIIDGVISLIENNPNAQSKQPLVNGQAMSSMVNPYNFAWGGMAVDELDESQLDDLQSIADERGLTLEETLEQLQQEENEDVQDVESPDEDSNEEYVEQDDTSGDESEYAMGGSINIKPSKRGTFTAAAKKHDKSVQSFASQVLANKGNYSPAMVKKANFARNASKWHGLGGYSDINVEGGEVMETPDGHVGKVRGAKHEEGGVDVSVPKGTKIFSDRLKINGDSMQKRKLKRERAIKRLETILQKDPTNKLIKNTYERRMKFLNEEDNKDMILQNVANKIYSPKQIMAGRDKGNEKYGPGGTVGMENSTPFNYSIDSNDLIDEDSIYGNLLNTDAPSYSVVPNTWSNDEIVANNADKNTIGNFTAGDYIGMAGSLFNGIAPLINTNNAAKATPPNVNRYRGFGHDAIEANDMAERVAATTNEDTLDDIDIATNTAYNRNRNSAVGINTLRALDAITGMGANKARVQANTNYANSRIGLLGQRGNLTNLRDRMEMAGQTQADIETKGDIDNYYTNKGANLVNLGNSVEGIGRNFNISKSNKVNANLLSQLSQYGLEFDEDGNLISKHG